MFRQNVSKMKLLLGLIKTVLESKKSILQKYSGSQKLSQIGKSRLFSFIFQYYNFRNKFIMVFYSFVRVVNFIALVKIKFVMNLFLNQ
ncbi:hypothetical protein LEP1GSC188_1152 [Leptospira weilii serovar Topaz str. LT2116]|uniref:Transmembrane protein n=1 Tax=Leptospira weilii serovar Topaz str. LT2116 TaxID=1088540 RepID=M3H3D6_9LEPT|nr:hypothetical protein LEP1GSC188_1152 [Leptospira weilii serovar Topaz str. LT2116]